MFTTHETPLSTRFFFTHYGIRHTDFTVRYKRTRYGALHTPLRCAVLGVERGDAREGVAAEQRVGGAQDAAGQGSEGGRVVEEVLVRVRVRVRVTVVPSEMSPSHEAASS